MDKKQDIMQDIALSTSKILSRSDIKDVKNIVGGATDGMVYELHRQVVMCQTVMWIERSVTEVKAYIKWAWVKFAGFSMIGSMIGGILYYYCKIDLLKLVDRWGILGHIVAFAIMGSAINNLFDFFLLETLFRYKIYKEPKYTIMVDFYTCFRLSVPGGAGVWLTAIDIQSELLTCLKREYSLLELIGFLGSEPYIMNRPKTKDENEYLIEKLSLRK